MTNKHKRAKDQQHVESSRGSGPSVAVPARDPIAPVGTDAAQQTLPKQPEAGKPPRQPSERKQRIAPIQPGNISFSITLTHAVAGVTAIIGAIGGATAVVAKEYLDTTKRLMSIEKDVEYIKNTQNKIEIALEKVGVIVNSDNNIAEADVRICVPTVLDHRCPEYTNATNFTADGGQAIRLCAREGGGTILFMVTKSDGKPVGRQIFTHAGSGTDCKKLPLSERRAFPRPKKINGNKAVEPEGPEEAVEFVIGARLINANTQVETLHYCFSTPLLPEDEHYDAKKPPGPWWYSETISVQWSCESMSKFME